MTLEKILNKVNDERLKLEIKLALSRSVKRGGALADVEYDLVEISKKLEKAAICSRDDFYRAFYKAHNQQISF